MRSAIIILAVSLAIVLALAWRQGVLVEGSRVAGQEALSFLPVLLVAFLLMGYLQVLLPDDLVETWLSGSSGWRGILVGWGAGILTPGGSIIGLPIAAGLYKAGAGAAVLVTYLTSLALLSVLRFPIELGFLGWRLTMLRFAAGLFLPPIAGMLAWAVTR